MGFLGSSIDQHGPRREKPPHQTEPGKERDFSGLGSDTLFYFLMTQSRQNALLSYCLWVAHRFAVADVVPLEVNPHTDVFRLRIRKREFRFACTVRC